MDAIDEKLSQNEAKMLSQKIKKEYGARIPWQRLWKLTPYSAATECQLEGLTGVNEEKVLELIGRK